MTQEEARKFLMNKKVFVKNKSKEIQLKLFEIGFGWDDGSTKRASYLTKPFLFMYKDMTLAFGDDVDYFYKDRFEEISAEDILNIKIEHLPKTWEEFCKNNPVNDKEACIAYNSNINTVNSRTRVSTVDRNTLPSYEAAEAHRALMQLHQLRNCYRGDSFSVYCYSIIRISPHHFMITRATDRFLSFPTKELAEEFLSNFKDLIEEAGDLI